MVHRHQCLRASVEAAQRREHSRQQKWRPSHGSPTGLPAQPEAAHPPRLNHTHGPPGCSKAVTAGCISQVHW